MGLETLVAVAAVSAVAGGTASAIGASKQAAAFRKQARIQEAEAAAEADRIKVENRKFEARQRLAFLKNGVSLKGSPILALTETLAEGDRQADATLRRGGAEASASRTQASTARNSGIAGLIGGLGQAASISAQGAFYQKSLQ